MPWTPKGSIQFQKCFLIWHKHNDQAMYFRRVKSNFKNIIPVIKFLNQNLSLTLSSWIYLEAMFLSPKLCLYSNIFFQIYVCMTIIATIYQEASWDIQCSKSTAMLLYYLIDFSNKYMKYTLLCQFLCTTVSSQGIGLTF